MTDYEETEFNRMMSIVVEKPVVCYRDQDFSRMNEQARGALKSLFSSGKEYDPMAGMQISLSMIMIGSTWEDNGLFAFATRAAQL